MPIGPAALEDDRVNAVLTWVVLLAVLFVAVEQTVGGDYLWAVLAASIVAIAVVPAFFTRDPTATPPWEAAALAALPLLLHRFDAFGATVAYVSTAALALFVAVELDAFTDVEMTTGFAVLFVVVVTMGTAGLWTIARFVSDQYLGTSLLTNQTALMWDIVVASGIGVLAGGVFELYFRRVRRGHALVRGPRPRGVDDSS